MPEETSSRDLGLGSLRAAARQQWQRAGGSVTASILFDRPRPTRGTRERIVEQNAKRRRVGSRPRRGDSSSSWSPPPRSPSPNRDWGDGDDWGTDMPSPCEQASLNEQRRRWLQLAFQEAVEAAQEAGDEPAAAVGTDVDTYEPATNGTLHGQYVAWMLQS